MANTPYPQSYYAASANAVPPRPVLQGEVETDVLRDWCRLHRSLQRAVSAGERFSRDGPGGGKGGVWRVRPQWWADRQQLQPRYRCDRAQRRAEASATAGANGVRGRQDHSRAGGQVPDPVRPEGRRGICRTDQQAHGPPGVAEAPVGALRPYATGVAG